MAFKKKKLEKTNLILNIVWWILICVMVFFWYYVFSAINNINFWSKKKFTETNSSWEIIEKNVYSKKEINVLLVWRSGHWHSNNDAPELIDVIILAKINSEKKTVSLLSIPRDLFVSIPDSRFWQGKINSIFQIYFLKWKDLWAEKEWIYKLAEKVEEITWESTDYYLSVDFKWFVKVIDAIWWVDIDVKKNLVDTQYPWKNSEKITVSFKKWFQNMDWETALIYARSRKSTSDYDRSLRQQQIIEAVKEKFKNISVSEVIRLFEIFTEHIHTDFSIDDVIWIAENYKLFTDKYTFVSSNINDTCFSSTSECEKWWIWYQRMTQEATPQSIILINWSTLNSLSNYELSKKYSNIVLNYPQIPNENFKINIFNWAWWSWVAWAFVNNMRKYWFNITRNNIFNAPERYEKSVIYYNWVWDSDTLNALKEFFKWEIIQLTEAKYPMLWKNLTTDEEKAKIEIIIWKDYLKDKSIFNF